jgi:hypothetical protein
LKKVYYVIRSKKDDNKLFESDSYEKFLKNKKNFLKSQSEDDLVTYILFKNYYPKEEEEKINKYLKERYIKLREKKVIRY